MIEEMDLRPDAIIAHSDQVASVIVSQYNKKKELKCRKMYLSLVLTISSLAN